MAHNGREALELFRQTGPDLVLTDIKMPVMDGLELLHALRALSDTVKVVLLTAFAEFDMARQALREGADEYLLKTEMNNEALQELLARMAKACDVDDAGGLMASAQAHAIVRKILRQEPPLSDADLAELRACGVRWRSNGLFALAVWKQSLMSGGLQLPAGGPGHHIAGFDYTDRIYVVVGNLPRALSSGEKSRQLTDYAKQVQQANRCMVGVSSVTDEMRQIPAMAKQAAFSLAQGFYTGQVKLYEPQRPLAELEARDKAWAAGLPALRMRLYQQRPGERYETLAAFLRDTAQREDVYKRQDQAVQPHFRRDFAGRRARGPEKAQHRVYLPGVFDHALADRGGERGLRPGHQGRGQSQGQGPGGRIPGHRGPDEVPQLLPRPAFRQHAAAGGDRPRVRHPARPAADGRTLRPAGHPAALQAGGCLLYTSRCV